MRKYKHISLQYFFDRSCEWLYQRRNPEYPWLTSSANHFLSDYLKPADQGLEFGSGRSTLWFSKRVKKIYSVEHDETWAKKVREMLLGVYNVDYFCIPPESSVNETSRESEYASICDRFENESLDFCLVDGIYRGACVLKVMRKIKPGGLLVIDNVNRYLPSSSISPDSRSKKDGALGEIWVQVELDLIHWRRLWTSSGVTDTAFFFKPIS